MDLEEVDYPGQLKKGLYFLVYMDQFHLTAHLPDDAITARQFAQTIAVDEIHAGKIDQELLAAGAGEDMDQVAKLSATVAQREPANDIHHNDVIQFSCGDLKTRGRLQLTFSADHMLG